MKTITAMEYIIQTQKALVATHEGIELLLSELFFSAKYIANSIANASVRGMLGTTGSCNVQGEVVQQLDDIANNILIARLERSGVVAGVASEECAKSISYTTYPHARYLVAFDPLDGSSNLDANINVGTIFSIFARKNPLDTPLSEEEFLQNGDSLLGAGYILYGPSTVLVLSLGNGVHAFTLSTEFGEFLLSNQNIRMPHTGAIYSVNDAYSQQWQDDVQRIVPYFTTHKNSEGKHYSQRYVGSLVADIHRTLLYGGLFMYPTSYTNPTSPTNKLRLLYENIPLGFLVEQAGGRATNGITPITKVIPTTVHERSAFFAGSIEEMAIVDTILTPRAL